MSAEREAVVLIWTADERAMGEPFAGPDCLNRAHAFAADLRDRDDFPGALICVTGNDAAVEDRTARITAALASGDSPQATGGAS